MPDEPQAPQHVSNGSTDIYPTLTITPPTHPNRFFAFPVLGILVKSILLIPVGVWLGFVTIAVMILQLINPFIILLTGKYWSTAASLSVGMMRLWARYVAYLYGFSDRYPWYSRQNVEWCAVEMATPTNPNHLFAIPLFGFLARSVLLIPFYVFTSVVSSGVGVTVYLVCWAPVLFTGRYPESVFEFGRNIIRLNLSLWAYLTGLSDKYPNFSIDLSSHKNKKIAIIVVGILFEVIYLLGNVRSLLTEP
ncbi:MAG: DUF4389 domain-containing protein [bacterium]|nr:DUF4389 domain-containing protein [bacterium]